MAVYTKINKKILHILIINLNLKNLLVLKESNKELKIQTIY